MMALHSTQRTPSWLLRHRKAFERDVMCSGALFHLSSGQAPSTAQGADAPGPAMNSLGWGGQTAPSPESPRSPELLPHDGAPLRCPCEMLRLEMSLHSSALDGPQHPVAG